MQFLIRYGVALLTGIVTALSLFFMHRFMSVLVFLSLTAFVFLFLGIVHVLYVRLFDTRHQVGMLLYITWGAFVGFSTLIDLPFILSVFILFCFIVFYLLVFSTQFHTSEKRHIYKPIRRMTMMLLVFDAYAYMATVFALLVFFPIIPVWLWGVIGVLIYIGITCFIWRLYFDVRIVSLSLWFLLIGIVMLELFWVFQLFPFGFLVSSFLLTWLWYVLQLFLRFHLSRSGILWRKQRLFLVGNVVLFVVMLLFIVRWI